MAQAREELLCLSAAESALAKAAKAAKAPAVHVTISTSNFQVFSVATCIVLVIELSDWLFVVAVAWQSIYWTFFTNLSFRIRVSRS